MPTNKPITTTPDNIEAIARKLGQVSADLAAVAERIRLDGFAELSVTNFGQLANSVRFARNFCRAAEQALWDAQQKRGDFGTIPHKAPNNNGKKPRGKS